MSDYGCDERASLITRRAGTQKRIQLAMEEFQTESLDAALRECTEEIETRESTIFTKEGQSKMYKTLLTLAKNKHTCAGCNRDISAEDQKAVEIWMNGKIESAGKEQQGIRDLKEELAQWKEQQQAALALLGPSNRCKEIEKTHLPAAREGLASAEKQLLTLDTELDKARASEIASQNAVRDLNNLKLTAAMVARGLRELEEVSRDVVTLEKQLASTGSTKTVTEVQKEIKLLAGQLKDVERERQELLADKEQQQTRLRSLESQKQTRQLALAEAKSKQIRRQENESSLKEHQQTVQKLEAELLVSPRIFGVIHC